MSTRDVSFGDNNHAHAHHRHGAPAIFKHRVGPDGNFIVSPIQLLDR